MKKIKNPTTMHNYRTESTFALKLKEMIREFREKNLFYLEHSKFATYVPKDYMKIFREEIIEFSKAWIRMQQKNMSSEKNPGIEGHANTRGLHVMDTAINAEIAAGKLLLNEELAYTGGLIHDIAHTSYAHEGEHFLSQYLEREGICELHHSSLARLILEIEGIHDKVLKRLEEEKCRPLTKREKQNYRSAYLSISDIAVCHNGEGGLTEVETNRDKSDQDIENEYIDTFIKKGLDRRTKNRTKEGAVVLFSDPISYVAKDFRDGIIKGLIDVNDSEYEDIFIRMGLTKEQLDKWRSERGKKDKIVAWVTRKLRGNLVENSREIDGIRMNREMANLMYELRGLNYEKIVKPGLRKINDILPERTGKLIDKYSDLLIEYETGEFNDSLRLNQYRHKMLTKFTAKKSENVESIYDKIVRSGIEENVINEIEDILAGKSETKTVRRQRLEEDIAQLREEGEITDEVKKGYINRVLKEISLSPKESNEMLIRRLKIKHPNATDEQLNVLAKEKGYLRLPTYTECLAKLKVAVYIGESTNDFLIDMLQEEGLITEEERNQRYVFGGNAETSSITAVIQRQEEEKRREQQAKGEERI